MVFVLQIVEKVKEETSGVDHAGLHIVLKKILKADTEKIANELPTFGSSLANKLTSETVNIKFNATISISNVKSFSFTVSLCAHLRTLRKIFLLRVISTLNMQFTSFFFFFVHHYFCIKILRSNHGFRQIEPLFCCWWLSKMVHLKRRLY